MFDPYSKWLELPAASEPPNFYELLDIDPDETDAKVIEEAALDQIAKVKPHRKGPHSAEAKDLLDEIEEARETLLSPADRKKYDAEIGISPRKKEKTAAGRGPSTTPAGKKKVGGKDRPTQPAKKGSNAVLFIVGGIAVLLLLVVVGGGTAVYLLAFGKSEDHASNIPTQPVLTPPVIPDRSMDPPATTKATPTQPIKTPPTPPPPPPPPPSNPPPAPPAKPPAPAPRVKLPVPDAKDQARAEQKIRDTYKTDYSKTKPEEQLALAAKLLVPGRENRNDPAEWFVILREARDLAVKAENPRLALEAIREIDDWFIIDASAMGTKAIEDISKSSSETFAKSSGDPVSKTTFEAVSKVLALTSLGESKRAITNEKYDVALKFVGLAETASGKLKDPKDKDRPILTERISTRRATIEEIQKNLPTVEAARKKLKDAPNDAEANAVVGKHLCANCGRWDEGLPMLVKGNDPIWKGLAERDLASPAAGAPLLAVADGWWDLAFELQDKSTQKPMVGPLLRAKFWYDRLDPKAPADTRKRAAERVAAVTRIVPGNGPRIPPGSFLCRANPADRTMMLREGGGNVKSEEAIEAGLKWLAEHQSVIAKGVTQGDGRWSLEGFQHTAKCKNRCTEFAEAKRDVAGTALGLLPFLGAGHTHQSGPYANTIKKGLAFLISKQAKEGHFDGNMYDHGLATIAVCEAYGLTRDPGLAAPARAAVNYILTGQDSGGSWGYSAKTKGDTSVSGWQFTALKTAYYAGIQIPGTPFVRLASYLDSVESSGGLGYGYNAPGDGKATSAVGLLCREFMGWVPYSPDLTRGVDRLVALDDPSTVDKEQFSIYYIYYATQMMHHYGGPKWKTWNEKVRDRLLLLQDQGKDPGYEHQIGSWSPYKDAWAKQGGRLMYTSFALLALETYYHHVPLNGYGLAIMEE